MPVLAHSGLRRAIVLAAMIVSAAPLLRAQSTCDIDKSCIGNALYFPGGDLDYVDVFNTPTLNSIETTHAMTVEMWALVVRRPGVMQALAGVWGPRTDRDDKWLLYIDATDSLAFELSNDSTGFGPFDNTLVKAPMLYNTWIHIAAMWDGGTQEARLYIDGRLVARGRNSEYPLRGIRSTISYLQIASFNGQSNDPARFRTLEGTVDEFRIWNRIIPDDELRCQRHAALRGSEPGLILYFRLNEGAGDVLCDASRFNGRGNRRGAADFRPATRTVPPSIFITPSAFSLPLGCISDTVLNVTITDTSACGQRVSLALAGPDAGSFSLGATTLTLSQNTPVLVPVRTNLRISGLIRAQVVVTPLNGCDAPVVIPVDIVRATRLAPSMPRVVFDTLFGCENAKRSDTTLRLCNAGSVPLTVGGFGFTNGAFTALPSGWTAPAVLAPGECRDILLRFEPSDTGTFTDTLRVISDDPCPGSGLIPVSGRSVNIARLTISSIDFDRPGIPCRRSLNLAEEFFLRNTSGENFTVETIEFTNAAFSTPTAMPFTARPGQSYRMYIRFRSNVEGVYTDTARVRIAFRGCTVYRSIPLRGRIIDLRLAANDTLVNFGTVTVGRSATLPVTLRNDGIDTRDIFVYLSSGRVFSLAGGSRFSLAPAAALPIAVTFRPLGAQAYRDTLCFQDVGCQTITRVVLVGNGVFGTLVFAPPYVQSGNVINCRCRVDTVTVTNATGGPVTLRSVTIAGSTKFTLIAPVPVPGEILSAGAQRRYAVQYCPDGAPDFLTERADLVFDTDGPDGILRMMLTGTNIEPKLTIDGMTNYGDVEVGTSQTRILKLTNPSPTPVRVESIPPLPPGFSVVSAVPPVGSVLGYRDTMLVGVQFAPATNIVYSGTITATSTDPCTTRCTGDLTGRGIIVPLFVPWSTVVFSEVSRCDSVVRVIGLVNDGSVPITVDSIWLTGPGAAAFEWRGRTFSGTPPRATPPRFADSIDVVYHPDRSPSVQSQAQLHIAATTRLGQQTFTINLVGGRILQFIPNRTAVVFPATPVRVAAAPAPVAFQNPSYLETLYIDSVSFLPDQGVFSYSGSLPLVIAPRQRVSLNFGFLPRAAVTYTAKVRLVTRVGCVERDTSISISGEGYTPPWLTSICVDTTIVAEIGQVLRLPVTLNRSIPQNPLDIDLVVQYHRRALQYLGFEPVYTRIAARDTLRTEGVKISLRGNQNVGAGPIGYISFRVAASDSMRFFLRTDSIDFASDSTFFIALFGDGCIRTVTINPRCGVQRIVTSANRYELAQNFPNPFRTRTTVVFETLEDTQVRIEVRDTRGRLAAVLTDAPYQHGRYQLVFDATGLASGLYNLVMTTANFTATRTMLVTQ